MLLACEENGVVGLLIPDAEIGSYAYIDEINEEKVNKIKNLPKITIKEFSDIPLIARDGKVYFKEKDVKILNGNLKIDKVTSGVIR
ncbi:MAG: hypothetical protein KatS3mg002_0973 [Candidatus Woesearchaeota archaeon]|nr:MAG: hypothetical protein KatS3mg002_0973 [Candidatus Woesearchaeota archaeon]